MKLSKEEARKRRHLRVRKKIVGSAERPRISVHRSLCHLYLQIMDDMSDPKGSKSLLMVTTNCKDRKESKRSQCTIAGAKALASELAAKAKERGITKLVFDRSGYPYHGVVKAVAETLREVGIKV